MNFDNPTQIVIGMKCNFSGKSYRVGGRVVLGVVQAGVTYYWNEYNLVTEAAESATLVYEVTERGAEWRVFTMFEPQSPMSAEVAATKRWGDLVNLDGTDYHVTRVDRSRIYHVEGIAPEGEVVNAVAHYFNASAGIKMLVVSWTGSEVEFYRGMNVSSGMVASAFNLNKTVLLKFHVTSGVSYLKAKSVMTGVLVIFIGLLIVCGICDGFSGGQAPPSVHTFTAPTAQLKAGDSLTLEGTNHRVSIHSLVGVDEVEAHSQWHEYGLVDDNGSEGLLIHGFQPGQDDWFLFTSLHPVAPMTPTQAAGVGIGQVVNADDVFAAVTGLFRSKVLQAEGSGTVKSQPGEVRFGFIARKNSTVLLARWNEGGITFHQGKALSPAAVKAALGKTSGK